MCCVLEGVKGVLCLLDMLDGLRCAGGPGSDALCGAGSCALCWKRVCALRMLEVVEGVLFAKDAGGVRCVLPCMV